tara:strand:+ start:260 stop:811 length:552 start_codon:yes stop_codon:yes gene_type:complete
MLAAEQIFLQRGFNKTTMEEVATAAGLHVQTLYRHFPSKSELATAINDASFEAFQRAFHERHTSTVSFWREWVRTSLTKATSIGTEAFQESLRERFLKHDTPAEIFEIDSQYESLLASGLAEDLGLVGTRDKRPMLIACMLWGSHKQMLREWATSGSVTNPINEAVSVVNAAIDLLNVDQSLE